MRTLSTIAIMVFACSVFGQSTKLSGRVTDSSGSIMPTTQIKLYHSDQLVKQATTSATGDFDIAVDPAEYKIEVTAPDFQAHVETVNVTPDMAPLVISMN